jgi:hypothetical protein
MPRPDYALDTAPPDVQALAAAHGMGRTFRTYEAAAHERRRPTAAGIYLAFMTLIGFGLYVGGGPSYVLLYLAALFVGALLVVAVRKIVKAIASTGDILSAGSRVYLFDSGLIHSGLTDRGKPEAQAFRWDEVSVFRSSNSLDNFDPISRASVAYTYTVRRPDRSAVVLRPTYWSIGDINELGSAITAGVGAVQVPRALAAVRRGETVTFGNFSVSDRGFRYHKDKKPTPWDHLERIRVVRDSTDEGDYVAVRTTDGFFGERKYPLLRGRPNDWVLVEVAEALIRDGRRAVVRPESQWDPPQNPSDSPRSKRDALVSGLTAVMNAAIMFTVVGFVEVLAFFVPVLGSGPVCALPGSSGCVVPPSDSLL